MEQSSFCFEYQQLSYNQILTYYVLKKKKKKIFNDWNTVLEKREIRFRSLFNYSHFLAHVDFYTHSLNSRKICHCWNLFFC